MKMILLLVTAGLVGWWMWTSMGGPQGTAAMPGGGPQPVIEKAGEAVNSLNDANRKMQEAIRQAVPPAPPP
jgi:hypothetical protein